uniref:WRKY transcription factor 19 n=1 Tax=Cajanus cajan TaxID=3821 RepID=A0A151R512_CAJCA|nr:putative WRKY transcription factor 19 [Cajanus cajan]
MDGRFQNLTFTANPSANAFKILGNSMQVEGRGADCCTDTILQHDSRAFSISKGTKRKWDLIDGSMAKEIDEESSLDIELDFTLHLGCEKVQSPKNPASSNLKIFELQPKVDLKLCLSTQPSDSDITSVCLSPSQAPPLQLNTEIPLVFSRTTNADEGSTSCFWKPGLVSLNTGASLMLNQAAKKFEHNIGLDLLSTRPRSSVTCTSGLTQQKQPLRCNSNSKTCQVEGCGKGARGASGHCISHGGGRRCQKPGCNKGAVGRAVYCKSHGGGRQCEYHGCTKSAEGRTDFCIAHGGGKCCAYQGGGICTKSVHGGTNFCVAHGAGMRCAVPDCIKGARGQTDYCVCHGGGKRCKFEGCGKSAQGGTDFCKAHGGGKRCCWGHPGSEYSTKHGGPCNSFARGETGLCALHSGLVLDKRVHGGVSLEPVIQDTRVNKLDELKQMVINQDMDVDTMKMHSPRKAVAVPEGRVHGGILMAKLMESSDLGTNSGRGLLSDPSETIKACIVSKSKI